MKEEELEEIQVEEVQEAVYEYDPTLALHTGTRER